MWISVARSDQEDAIISVFINNFEVASSGWEDAAYLEAVS